MYSISSCPMPGIGGPVRGDMLELEPDAYDLIMGVNLRDAVFLSQKVTEPVPSRPRLNNPVIVFMSWASSELVSNDRAHECIPEVGLSMWAKALAVRRAPEGIPVFEVRAAGRWGEDVACAVLRAWRAGILLPNSNGDQRGLRAADPAPIVCENQDRRQIDRRVSEEPNDLGDLVDRRIGHVA